MGSYVWQPPFCSLEGESPATSEDGMAPQEDLEVLSTGVFVRPDAWKKNGREALRRKLTG